MPKNEIVVVDNWKNDLQKEAVVTGRKLVNNFLNEAKEPASEYVSYAVKRIIDHFIFRLNA